MFDFRDFINATVPFIMVFAILATSFNLVVSENPSRDSLIPDLFSILFFSAICIAATNYQTLSFPFIAALVAIVVVVPLLLIFLSYVLEKKEKKEEQLLFENLPSSTISVSTYIENLEELLPFPNKTVDNDVKALIKKIQNIQSVDDKGLNDRLQDFTNKYLSILYISLQNYKKLGNPDVEVSNNMILTLKTINTALDKILEEHNEILEQDINSTTSVITSILAPKVKESPFENQKS